MATRNSRSNFLMQRYNQPVKLFNGVFTTILMVGIALLLWGCFSYPREMELATAGSILIGSWLISLSIITSK